MLFVGGSADGRNYVINSPTFTIPTMIRSGYVTERSRMEMTIDPEVFGREVYTRRRFANNEGDRMFTVLALDSLSGDEVMHMLAVGDYKDNPLKWANKA